MLLKNITDKNQFTQLARQLYPEEIAGVYKAYLEATKKTHGYFLWDFYQDTDDQLGFQTNIFPDEVPQNSVRFKLTRTGLLYVSDEANKDYLSHSAKA